MSSPGNAADALARVDQLLQQDPHNPHLQVRRGRCLIALGRPLEARAAAAEAERCAAADPGLWDAIGGLYNLGNDQVRSLAAYDRAVALAPYSAHHLFNRAAVRRFLGQLAESEADYDQVIALRPDDFEAYKNRSDLRTQTRERNHVAELKALLAAAPANWQGEVHLRYALAKEYEDLGESEASFRELKLGATLRRAHLSYDVAQDAATVDWIIRAFPAGSLAAVARASDASPIFIVGLPRSGTTLVDRILGSHSAVRPAGELNDFALCVVAAVRRHTGQTQLPRAALVARSAEVDFAALGREYLERVARAGFSGVRFTDKMPLNYLYCGLIHRALPRAKIVHMRRHPLAVCYAMYKTLFDGGYPFSYDLAEIGSYYVAYRRLMDHWHAVMPGVIYDQSYEMLVGDQIGQTRRLLDYCGLPWEEDCVNFHRNPTATTTASAVQVRRQIYDSSVAQWRRYAGQLEPLRKALAGAGVDVSDAADAA